MNLIRNHRVSQMAVCTSVIEVYSHGPNFTPPKLWQQAEYCLLVCWHAKLRSLLCCRYGFDSKLRTFFHGEFARLRQRLKTVLNFGVTVDFGRKLTALPSQSFSRSAPSADLASSPADCLLSLPDAPSDSIHYLLFCCNLAL
jgi:hypothetical protein